MIIEVAKSTKTWHAKVMRVSVINCGDSYNEDLCRKHSINHYPTLRLFEANAQKDESAVYRGAVEIPLDTVENLITRMIEFVETQQSKQLKSKDNNAPALQWPDLTPFKYG